MSKHLKEYSLKELAQGLDDSTWTSVDLVHMYLNQIELWNKKVNAIGEINPDAINIAKALDEERISTGKRSMLHGIPIVIKDNINTNDSMHTTASSYALKDLYAPYDAFIVKKLREAGMIILGKANLSEFAYFMNFGDMPSGYGSRHGQVHSPYSKNIDPLGSSTGSAVAVATNMIPVSIGTETNGSLMAPAQQNSIVSIKPTLGLVSRTGIIPISHLQDTAGPMSRTVEDSALLLEILIGKDETDEQTLNIPDKSYEFSKTVHKDIKDFNLGFLTFSTTTYTEEELNYFSEAKQILKPLVNHLEHIEIEAVEMANVNTLIYEFKYTLNKYFDTVKERTNIHSLKDLINYNIENKEICLKYGQKLFVISEEETNGDLKEPKYLEAREKILHQANEFNRIMKERNLDVLVLMRRTSHAPIAGNPIVAVPAKALTDDTPRSLFFVARNFEDSKCIQVAYQYEQHTKKELAHNFNTMHDIIVHFFISNAITLTDIVIIAML